MPIAFWFATDHGLGYGVTAFSGEDARELLRGQGYPSSDRTVVSVTSRVSIHALDQNHVVTNAGPIAVRGVWYPGHNV